MKSPKLRGEDESGEEESELNLKKPTPGGASQHREMKLLVILYILS